MNPLALIFIFCLAETKPVIEAKLTTIPPKIDGQLEPIWFEGDSAKNFIQQRPDEGKPATESTTVYLLNDQENIYVAYKCYCRNLKSINRQVEPRDNYDGDRVTLLFDTFDDQNTGYCFVVNAAGVQADFSVSADFRNWDNSWDGVWYSAASLTNFGYCVEIQIPFRTIRYKTGIPEWGINFGRYIAAEDEQVHWVPQPIQGYRVSLSGRLIGIKPGIRGVNLEVYPVALGRYDETDKIKISPDAGLDVSWMLGSASKLQLTANPDFAQIEADPSQINLSKYDIWYPERRPFFIEDAELFTLSGIQTFYSRRIGRPLPNGKAVPIMTGAKLVTKFNRLDIGLLNALCQKVDYEVNDTNYTEPLAYFGILRLRQHVLKNSNLGLLYATKIVKDSSKSSLNFDGAFQQRDLAIKAQAAYSESRSSDMDTVIHAWAQCYQVNYESEKFGYAGEVSYLPENFNDLTIGFINRSGLGWWHDFGPNFYNFGIIRSFSLRGSVSGGREASEAGDRLGTGLGFESVYNNKWGNWIGFSYNRDYEMDSSYNQFNTDIDFWSDQSRPLTLMAELYGTSKSYNYRPGRGYFAPYVNLSLEIGWQINPSFKSWIGINSTVEWDTTGQIEAVGWILHPTVGYALTKDLHLRIYSELNLDSKIHYLNLLLSWNIRPKSWIYLAFNESHDANQTNFPLIERIGVVKIRYLFFF